MIGPEFVFFLQDKLRRFWQLDSSGNAVLLGNPYALDFSPDGWADLNIQNIRNRKYWGIDRSVSTPFKFVEDGAEILKHIYYTLGVEEEVFLVIAEKQVVYNPGVNYGFWYKQIFRSQIDLSTFAHDGAEVTVNTAESGLVKHLRANEGTAYEIELTDFVKMDGVTLRSSINFLGVSQYHAALVANYNLQWLSLQYLQTDGTTPNHAGASVTPVDWNSNSSKDDNRYPDAFFIEATAAVTVRLQGSITCTLIDGLSAELYVKNSNGTRTTLFTLNSDNPSTPNPFEKRQTFAIDQAITLAAGEKLFLISEVQESPFITGSRGGAQYDEFQLNVVSESAFRTTYVKAARPQAVFATLIDRITAGEYQAENCPYLSDLYHSDKVLTSGDALRGIEGAKLRISLADFFGFFDTFDAVGLREKAGRVLLDRKAALVDASDVIDLGEAGRLRVKYDKSYAFNELAAGYPDVKNESGMLNGKNEVNTTFTFSLGTTSSPRKYDKTTRVKVSCYDIENVRIEGSAKNSTDNRADNDVYALHIKNTLVPASGDIPAHYELNRAYNTSVTGVDQAASVFNLIFSPKNCILRSGDYLRSCFFKADGKTFRFISADRNSSMVYADGVTTVAESADFQIGDLVAPFFVPVQLVIEAQAPADLLDRLDANPLAVMQFTFEGQTYRGLIDEVGINPKTGKQQTYTLLSSPANDLKKLIKYFG